MKRSPIVMRKYCQHSVPGVGRHPRRKASGSALFWRPDSGCGAGRAVANDLFMPHTPGPGTLLEGHGWMDVFLNVEGNSCVSSTKSVFEVLQSWKHLLEAAELHPEKVWALKCMSAFHFNHMMLPCCNFISEPSC